MYPISFCSSALSLFRFVVRGSTIRSIVNTWSSIRRDFHCRRSEALCADAVYYFGCSKTKHLLHNVLVVPIRLQNWRRTSDKTSALLLSLENIVHCIVIGVKYSIFIFTCIQGHNIRGDYQTTFYYFKEYKTKIVMNWITKPPDEYENK